MYKRVPDENPLTLPRVVVYSPKRILMLYANINFIVEIEKRVNSRNSSYLDAVVDVCEEFEIDQKMIVKYLNKTIIEKIKIEAQHRNLFRGKKPEKGIQLPI
jgi:hypothetical protein